MYYYMVITDFDNPILTDLSKRKMTIYDSAWSDSYFTFYQYLIREWEHRKNFSNQEIHSGSVQTLKELETVITKRFKFESFDEFYRLCKLKIRSDKNHTVYIISVIGRFNYLKVKIKRELPGHLAEAITRMLLITILLRKYGRPHLKILEQVCDSIYKTHSIISKTTIDDIDPIMYLKQMVNYKLTAITDFYEL